ncbi:vWA domain-containing protein [Catellatospora citrea]|uniref:VWA domain-containing protein n=1 Tax=Catellatospora citrea TaxID=53366 RepID=A0A8J3KG89_9ACTN|nr:extracellular solute-binding protein [Catellatospora citrea]RKE02679.1 Ca-activated chloride channel family protein [Catellatospora citrea]GIF99511.1 VWA domain-containing protein [Catellatospora citrea]
MASRRTQRWLPVAFAATVGFALIAGSYVYVSAVAGDRGDCVALDVVSSTEKSDLVKELAERYNDSRRRFGGRCADVTVTGLTSGQAMEALAGDWAALSGTGSPRPQVWLPTSTLWTGQLRLLDKAAGHPEQTPGEYASIANSPLVIAMPATKARFLQQQGALGWGDILGMSGEKGWAEFGKPEWKRFTFGKDNPNLSTSGLAATIATYYAATGTSSDLTAADVRDPKVTRFVRQIEANVSHYSDDVVDLLRSLAAVDLAKVDGEAAGSDLSAVVTQEELVYLYNTGALSNNRKPREQLVALYPKEGTFNLDHPYVVLPQANDAQRAGAADFLAFLQEAPQQREFAAIGFRDHEQTASDQLVQVVGGAKSPGAYFEPPSPEVVQGIKAGWETLRKKANILMAVDVSGSMTANKVGTHTRLEYAMDAAKNGIKLLNSEDRVGLWAFSAKQAGSSLPYRPQLPLSRLDDRQFGAKLDAMRSGGGTALYTTIRAAHRHMLENYDRTRINAVVVLTDGENEYPEDNDLAKLLRDIALDPDRPVKVFCIAFDQGSDLPTLEKIAAAAAGKAFDAQDPAKIDEAFVKLLSSF